jgi:nicotinamidase-related amidase
MLIDKDNCSLVIFNLQRDFIPSLIHGQDLIDSCCWLADLAQEFQIPTTIIHHKKLGEPIQSIIKMSKNSSLHESTYFSCTKDKTTIEMLQKLGKKQILLAGAESHISILHSAVELKSLGFHPFIITDSITSRNLIDHTIALDRMKYFNIQCVTKEMVFFELIRQSEYPNYINLSLKFLDRRYIRE